MSLSDLPTELDNRIATFLIDDSPSFNALSKVSKYYHRIAQSHLYTHVVLKANDRHGLMCLCYAIITQKGVRLRIRSFSLEPFPEPPESYLEWAQMMKAVSSLWFVPSVEKAIHIYLQRHRIAAFYPSQRSPTYMLDRRPESGMVLAFILCAALNIEEIKVSNAVYNSRDQITIKGNQSTVDLWNSFPEITETCCGLPWYRIQHHVPTTMSDYFRASAL